MQSTFTCWHLYTSLLHKEVGCIDSLKHQIDQIRAATLELSHCPTGQGYRNCRLLVRSEANLEQKDMVTWWHGLAMSCNWLEHLVQEYAHWRETCIYQYIYSTPSDTICVCMIVHAWIHQRGRLCRTHPTALPLMQRWRVGATWFRHIWLSMTSMTWYIHSIP